MDSVQFELEAPRRGVRVAVRLRPAGDRWIAIAAIAGVEHGGVEYTGVGGRPLAALVASLSSLERAVVAELLLDLRLLDVSCRVRALTVA
jgi:hypothetical protein